VKKSQAIILLSLLGYTSLVAQNTSHEDPMGYKIRKANDRGHFDHGWLKASHTFSFGDYYDPKFMSFRTLRVINEDVVQPGQGFPFHGHKDMEILTYIIDGELAHKDSMGTGSTIKSGEIQLMSAGKGVKHSEYNPSTDKPVHLLQIWIEPDQKSYAPRYDQKKFTAEKNQWQLIVSEKGDKGTLPIRQSASVYLLNLDKNASIDKKLGANRYGWLQVISGKLKMAEATLSKGDGVSFDPGSSFTLSAEEEAKALFFDLP
jgi:quercetin 2,3-dioxygenase